MFWSVVVTELLLITLLWLDLCAELMGAASFKGDSSWLFKITFSATNDTFLPMYTSDSGDTKLGKGLLTIISAEHAQIQIKNTRKEIVNK